MKSLITKILLWLAAALIIIYIVLSGVVKDELNMASKVGSRLGGGELSIRENSLLTECINTYLTNIVEEKYENAYGMLGASYRNYIPYDEWLIKAQNLDISNMIIQSSSIEIISKSTFCVPVANGENIKKYLVIINNQTNRFAIYPDNFLDYNSEPQKLTNHKITYTIVDYKVYGDKIVVNLDINNKSKKELTLENIYLNTNYGTKYTYSGDISLNMASENLFTLDFENDYTFPKSLKINAKLNDKPINDEIEIDFN